MKKLTTITLSVIAGSVLAYNANALTCGAQPSCSDLGYTITSTSNCVGTVLKCPFDKTKYYCTQKSDIFSNMALNWNNKKTFNKRFYPSQYGFVFVTMKDTGGGAVSITVNGINFQGSYMESGVQFYAVPVKPGDSISVISYNDSLDKFYFVPFAGN